MSIKIKFGSSPEAIHSVGNLGEDIWDIIYTLKEEVELRDAAEIPDWWIKKICRMMSKDMKAFCRTHKIQQKWTWEGSNQIERGGFAPSTRLGMAVNILFQLILKKNPQPYHPKHWLKEDLQQGWFSGRHGAITYRVGVRCAEPISGLSLYNQITKFIHHDNTHYDTIAWAGKYTRLDRNTKLDLIERQQQIRNFLQGGQKMSSALEKKIADLTPKANQIHMMRALADPKLHWTDPGY